MMMSRKALIVAAALVVLIAGFYVKANYFYPITNRSGSGTAIVALGDSLTYGTGAGKGEDWPSLVRKKCRCEIYNAGIPGDTTQDALSRMDKDVVSRNPRIVIVGLGGNDVLQRQPEEQMFRNLREVITRAQRNGAMVVLLGLNGFPLGGSLASGYKALAKETGSVYVPDIMGGILSNPKLKSDQIHPNAAGYQVMAEKIYNRLEPYL